MNDENESREPTERSANRTNHGLAIFFAVMACYVLSPVPVMWGFEKLGIVDRTRTAFETFYAPLGYLAEHCEFVESFYEWQARLVGL